MKPLLRTSFFLITLVLSLPGIAKTAYPLYAISSQYTPFTPSDLKTIAENFNYFRAVKLTKSDIDALHQINPNLKTLQYINSSGSFTMDEARNVEMYYRNQISMYHVAILANMIDQKQTQFKLDKESRDIIPLKCSKTKEDYSIDNQNYVIWIRIDNELMKVIDFNYTTNEINVQRGFAKTTPASHQVKAKVFAPVYIGFPTTPGGNDHKKRLRYAYDVTTPLAVKHLVDGTYQAIVQQGYDGMWFDTFSAGNFNHYDMFKNVVHLVWDFNKNAYANREQKREQQEIRLNTVQNQLAAKLGQTPPLFANNMHPSQYWPGNGHTRLFLMPTDLKPRPLDGYCIEAFAGVTAGRGQKPFYKLRSAWIANVKMLMDASQKKLSALPMIANAGVLSSDLEPAGKIRDDFEAYGYASFLMAVEKNSKIMFGIPAYYFYTDQNIRKAWVHPRYFLPIGAPTETQTPENIGRYVPTGHVTYVRNFENGLVLVNPTDQADLFDFNTAYYDPDAERMITSLTMAPATGKILLKTKPQIK